MKRFLLTAAFILSFCVTGRSQTASRPDVQTFDLTPAAPPSPALKYQLLYDDGYSRLPGNAAILYLDSALLMGPDGKDKADKALQAYDSKHLAQFNFLADPLMNIYAFQELDQAGRREECNWQDPFHEMGVNTLLPHLSAMRDLGRLIKVRALRQVDMGKPEDALKTLRLGYELSDKVGREPILISGLVSLNILSMMNDSLSQLMNRADTPNLYWALSEFPSRQAGLRHLMDGEKWFEAYPMRELTNVEGSQDPSADQWRAVFEYIGGAVQNESATTSHANRPDPVALTTPEQMRQAEDLYGQMHQLSADQLSKIDPIIVVGNFYYQQYKIVSDDIFKLRGLPYPLLMSRTKQSTDRLDKAIHEQPGNLFLQFLPQIHKAVWTFARTDRQLAALTAVEAIRSYAAANGGALPARLEDISDTPVPANPATGEPFEYKELNNIATLSDSKSESGLTYTIKIRK